MYSHAPDVVYVNGQVVTVDANDSVAEAFAVKGDRVVAVGASAEIAELAGAGTKVVDLGERCVLPGINDSHMHGALYGGSRPPLTLNVGHPAVGSIEDIKAAVAAKAAESKPGEWIRGMGWDEAFLSECRADPSRRLTRHDLDAVAPDNPVYLVSFTQHELVANTRALELAGIGRDTAVPTGSEILKDAVTGEPTGMLMELPAQGLLMRVVPLWTRQDKRNALQGLMRAVNSRGITSITDAALGPGGIGFQGGLWDSECISVYNDLLNDGALTARINILYLFGSYGAICLKDFEETVPLLGVHSGFGNEWLRIAGIKLFADGIPHIKTAWMRDEYPSGGNGSLVVPGETERERYDEFVSIIRFAHRHGFQCGIHAIGGRAIEACIDGFLQAEAEEPKRLRHYLIHCDFISEDDIRRVAENDIGISAQPILKWLFSDAIDEVVGLELSAYQYPMRRWLDAGIHVSASSDAPVTEPDWLQGIEAAVLRKSKASGTVRGPEHRVSVPEALRMYTMGGAWQDHQEHLKGSLEPGKLADFCVLDRDILNVPHDEIHTLRNLATVVGGRVVYAADDAPLSVEAQEAVAEAR